MMDHNEKHQLALILLVEANPVLRQNLRDIFDLAGYRVVTASNGAEGLDILRKLLVLPDVIVADVTRADQDGCQFFKAVRREYQRPTISFIFLAPHFKGSLPCGHIEGEAVEIVTMLFPVAQLLEAVASANSQAQVG